MNARNSVKIGGAVAIGVLLAFKAGATIDYTALNYPGNLIGNQGGSPVDRALGFVFTVNSAPIYISQLGAFDNPGNGLGVFGGNVSVAIYRVTLGPGGTIASGSLAVSPVTFSTASPGTVIPGTDTTMKNISTVGLNAGTYMLVANHYGNVAGTEDPWNIYYQNNPPYHGGGPPNPSANTGGGLITWNGLDYYMNSPASWGNTMPSGWTIPAGAGNYPRWTGGDFEFSPVPEVGTFGVAAVGVLGLVYVGRYARLRRRLMFA